MGAENWQEITLESESMEKARDNFNMLLQRLFKRMEQNNSDEGSITLKVNVEFVTDFMEDADGNSHRVNKPVLKHSVSSTVPVKDSLDGKQDTGMELVYDEELQRYVLKYFSAGGQRSIFDPDFGNVVDGEATEVDESHMIECRDDDGADESGQGDSGDSESESEEPQEETDENAARGCTEVTREPVGEEDYYDDDYEYDDGMDGYDEPGYDVEEA